MHALAQKYWWYAFRLGFCSLKRVKASHSKNRVGSRRSQADTFFILTRFLAEKSVKYISQY